MTLVLKNITLDWFGHSSFKINAGKIIYIDPYILPEYTQQADLILVTHEHYDHFALPNIKRLMKPETIIILPEACANSLNYMDLLKAKVKTHLVHQESKLVFGNIEIEAVPAYNIEKPYHPQGKGVGYVLGFGRIKIYHAGDTDLIPEMSNLEKLQIEAALLPMGGQFTMNEEDAAEAVRVIRPKIAVPMHYGKITGGDPYKFEKLVGAVSKVKVF
ncbi:MAG: MBL fold metallo-hydrolase [Nanoarchaeota archaeon]|nr:MBL fold metallo-hydrolase [Nanoarchaeota archaeon]MBU4451174.1 MBL fold metallo-hydrolase [Nanoarchaeota archaeon]MCG2724317.1 MBL fold metallo-hydrolase [archaeon]